MLAFYRFPCGEAFAQLAENGLLYSTNRLLDRASRHPLQHQLTSREMANRACAPGFLFFEGTSCRLPSEVKPLLFACLLNKDLRMYPLIRRVGAISLCKFMTVPLKQAAKSR